MNREIRAWLFLILAVAIMFIVFAIHPPEPKNELQESLVMVDRQEVEEAKIDTQAREMLYTEDAKLNSRHATTEQYLVTFYCSCEKCCGEWANNRKDGKVIGAGGVELIDGLSVAADLPMGTRLLIDGREYEVQDRGGAIKGKRIDIYCGDNHQRALDLGRKVADVEIMELGE